MHAVPIILEYIDLPPISLIVKNTRSSITRSSSTYSMITIFIRICSRSTENEDPAAVIERLLSDANNLITDNKDQQKTVSFGPTVEFPLKSIENKAAPSILKKSTVTPLKLPTVILLIS